jgi:hypothetical protein
MLTAGRLCNRVVECMFLVSSERVEQLRDCDTVTHYCGTWNCVGVCGKQFRHDSVRLEIHFFFVVVP